MSNNSSLISDNFNTDDIEEVNHFLTTIPTVLIILMCPIIIFTNVLTITAIRKFYYLQTPANMYVLCLSCADLLLGISMLFCTFRVFNPKVLNFEGDATEKNSCLICLGMMVGSAAVSYLTLTAMAVDRLIAVTRPFLYERYFSLKVVRFNIVLLWILGFIGMTVICTHDSWEPGKACHLSKTLQRLMLSIFLFIPCIILTLIISGSYARIIFTVRQQQQRITIQNNAILSSDVLMEQKRQASLKLAKTMLTVYGVLLLCYTPFIIVTLLQAVLGNDHFGLLIFNKYADVLVSCNSFINALIYGWRMPDFRRAYKQLLCGQCRTM
ncbi:unnamed protein product [Owenia fusiformis]|uniref:Uncharacterized protein n=1 Tax=Owenia fusiformis TaxID=6347 RepID=A0A8J1TBV2_OWEFU|nr:unnamed protein product [Owenia fusiformis]